MKIKINNKSHYIKPASELTVKEYLSYQDSLDASMGEYGAIIAYISAVTGFEINKLMSVVIDPDSTRRILAYVSTVFQPENMPEQKEFYYKRTAAKFHQNNIDWQTVGARVSLEQSDITDPLKQCAYLLACYLSKNYDNGKVSQIYKELQNYRALDVFGFNLFFFRKLVNGQSSGASSWQRLRRNLSINILRLLNRSQAID